MRHGTKSSSNRNPIRDIGFSPLQGLTPPTSSDLIDSLDDALPCTAVAVKTVQSLPGPGRDLSHEQANQPKM
ncbi:hypothetical protein ElyMa_001680200 [Elysia marginata]|uniref:Uncharacterized protein n=1 Tax=Elysia marginata TaxID=1093978 RepID=A0AAV4JS59_9GAST|nr:hypothetical protein ElyMa_001680200 [Elysia marginata]